MIQVLGTKPQTVFVDLCCRGVDKDNLGPDIKHLGKFKSLTVKKLIQIKQAFEPIIGYLKAEHRMCRSHLKGSNSNNLQPVLFAAGFNIRLFLSIIVKKGP
jgi:hypothetical protein